MMENQLNRWTWGNNGFFANLLIENIDWTVYWSLFDIFRSTSRGDFVFCADRLVRWLTCDSVLHSPNLKPSPLCRQAHISCLLPPPNPSWQIRLVVEEGLNQLPYSECTVTTPTGEDNGLKLEMNSLWSFQINSTPYDLATWQKEEDCNIGWACCWYNFVPAFCWL